MKDIEEVDTSRHSSLKQYVKTKPHKWGIKVFARAGSSGIEYDFEIYQGKGTVHNDTGLGISGDIVIRFVEGLPKYKNFKVFTDNWFTSYNLISALKNYGILAVGTVRPTRLQGCNLKADSELKKQGRGSYDYRTETERNIIALKWYDNKSVVLVSSYEGVSPVEPVKRLSVGERKYIDVPRPNIVKEYNRSIGGVDLHDMLVALYRSNIDVKRFYLRIVFHLLDMCVVNAWPLYRRHCRQRGITKHMSLLIFRSDVAHGDTLVRRRGQPSDDSPPPTVVKKRAPLVPNPFDDVSVESLGEGKA
ncbi:piggyBac transposable element-derived protein 2-like [Schistocerca cancellata]|uniref:piggyBac transposable element-derived protein 2-like n=1 Tax=Schistocerca cancellata TaxID=274614 RepID=UPI002119A168|nr:piggyBac transposable element-derived protein 2-like [Schistocerca cancellata]